MLKGYKINFSKKMRVIQRQGNDLLDVNLRGMKLPHIIWTLILSANSKKDSNGYKYSILKYELSLFKPIFKSVKRNIK